MEKNVLIVGGTGVISFAVVQEALKQGFNVTCINRGKSKNQILPPQVKLILSNYYDKDTILKNIETYYDVIVDILCYKPEDIEYSLSLFKDKCKQYIFFSSCAVYNKGDGKYECTEESELINPVWQYSIDKVKSEQKLIELAHKFNVIYTIVRPAVTYGNTRIPYGITPSYGYHGTIIQRLLFSKPIILWDNGSAYSTITRVEDFAIGLVGLFGNKKAYCQTFHIVGDERHTWKEVIDALAEILNVKPVYISLTKEQYAKEIPSRKGEILGGRGISQLLDNSKIKSAVPGFQTTISLKQGLLQTVNYYKEHNYLNGIDWVFEGDTDRIVAKWSKIMTSTVNYKTDFVDYFGNASIKEKLQYWLSFYKENKIVFVLTKVLRKINRLL